jgi:glucosamine-6-phosphate deaminase
MRLVIHPDYEKASRWAADYIAKKINTHDNAKPFILGLPTGSSPVGIYREFVKMNKEGKLSFKNVHTFNMDEYIGLPPDHPQSYHYFMMDNLFNHIDIDRKHIHLLDGMTKDPVNECKLYEETIAKEGGIDLFLGGMGTDGHIAFNEPGSSLVSRTRVKSLTIDSRASNARFFENDITKVPVTALTVGVGTIMDAREVVIIVSGRNKARALKAVVEDGINQMWTLSYMQMHPKAMIVCDDEATEELKVGTVNYFKELERNNLDV